MKILFCFFVGTMVAWNFTWFIHSCTIEKRLDRIIKLGDGRTVETEFVDDTKN